jgi:hypothetical protein
MYSYFEGKLYLENTVRSANEALDRERSAGLIGKINLIIREMQRLETKANTLAADLDAFVSASETNFQLVQKAIQAHTTFLNELDSKSLMDDLMTQAGFAEMASRIDDTARQLAKDLEYALDQVNQEVGRIEAKGQLQEDALLE